MIEPRGDLICLSGGMDSSTLLAFVLDEKRKIGVKSPTVALGFNYGQRHIVELGFAQIIAEYFGVEFFETTMSSMIKFAPNVPLTDPSIDIPKQTDGQQIKTVVPYRNAMFIMTAAFVAASKGLRNVWLAAVKEDFESYRDCRTSFFTAMQDVLREGSVYEGLYVNILAPFVSKTKVEVVKLGTELDVPWVLTHTCYNGQRPPCGECDACCERIVAFEALGMKDPLLGEV